LILLGSGPVYRTLTKNVLHGLTAAVKMSHSKIKPFYLFDVKAIQDDTIFQIILKIMRKIAQRKSLATALLLAALAIPMFAQQPGGPPPGEPGGPGGPPPGGPGRGFRMTEDDIKERVESTAETLNMSDEQHKKILAVEMDFYNRTQIEFQKMRNAGGPPAEGDREAMREKMAKMRADRNAEYEKVLTPEQFKKWTTMEEMRREQMRQQNRQNNPDGAPPAERPERGRGRG
jgi:hypothetical protein